MKSEITTEEYIKEHGYDVSDFTDEEIEAFEEDVKMVNDGIPFLDGFFSAYPLYGREGHNLDGLQHKTEVQ